MGNNQTQQLNDEIFDLVIIGGGINGTGIARDAALRGLKTCLFEKNDLGAETSSNSTKLIHGGLRYLEYFDFRLVRHALIERALLLKMLHRFVTPMRFVLPFVKTGKPYWLLRLGLWIYDHLGPLGGLERSKSIPLQGAEYGLPLKDHLKKGFQYSDCWVDDARLVILNALEAEAAGAKVFTRLAVQRAEREGRYWQVKLEDGREVKARSLVNATGPFVNQVAKDVLNSFPPLKLRLVKGSHIVTKRLFDHGAGYILQQKDGRIVFVLPYEGQYSLIGTTEEEFESNAEEAEISDLERDYLLHVVNDHFKRQISTSDICWSFSAVRPLIDDKSKIAKSVSRDFEIFMEEGMSGDGHAVPLLTIYGGKLTTFRILSEKVVDKLAPHFNRIHGSLTDKLAYAAFEPEGFEAWEAEIKKRLSFLPRSIVERWIRSYGMRTDWFTKSMTSIDDMGRNFGGGLVECEVRYLIEHEWAEEATDILWRRTKCGLHMSDEEIAEFEAFMKTL